MPWQAIARLWKHHAPRHCGWASPEFTVYEVSQAAGGQAQRNHGGDEVSDLEQGFAVLAGKQQQDHDNADKRSEERTSELQSLMRISYAVFCLKNKKQAKQTIYTHYTKQT